MSFTQRLKSLRKELNIKQLELAQACNVKLTAISKYETGIIKPSFEMLSKIGLAYNVNLNWLINDLGNMFIETPEQILLKNGTTGFLTETINNENTIVSQDEQHSLELSNDIKVEYFDANNDTYTKIYRKSGNVEYSARNAIENNFKLLAHKLSEVCKDKDQFEFIMTAINSLNDEKSLQELKTLIKGMELARK